MEALKRHFLSHSKQIQFVNHLELANDNKPILVGHISHYIQIHLDVLFIQIETNMRKEQEKNEMETCEFSALLVLFILLLFQFDVCVHTLKDR